jgi:glycosyltransferase involved in cell wall biosynthesis
MRIAIGIVKLFPEGGLQRDCIRLARILVERGHDVTVFTSESRGPLNMPACETVHLAVRSLTNHGTDLKFAHRFAAATAIGFDRVVGFNKLFGLDFYYCADPSVAERERNMLERSLPRHRVQSILEQESFGPLQHTHILALTQSSVDAYRRAWTTQSDRISLLQPSIAPERQRPELRSATHRHAVRSALGIAKDCRVWLWVGAQTHTKGLDRVIEALRAEPDTILLAAGVAKDAKDAIRIRRTLPRRAAEQIRFLGFREDIPDLMAAADVLVHPSRLDVTGQVILEAVVNGLPAVVSGLCGFAEHVEAAGSGVVLPEPFQQADLDAALTRLRDPALSERMSRAGIRYGHSVAPVTGLDQAADIIEWGAGAPPAVPAAAPDRPARLGVVSCYTPISLIVTTYNRPDALNAVLRGLAQQIDQHFEVIVADDGSTAETADLLKSWKTQLRQPLTHVWHEDRGFRAAEIRNRAILASSGTYCIFLDGDCIPRRNFVTEHRQLAEAGWFVVGNRVLMSHELTDRVLGHGLTPEKWTLSEAVLSRLTGGLNRISPLLQARLGPVRRLRPNYWWGARSCNLAVWRSDLDRIDGFDHTYVGWGLEDSDLLIRLLRAGIHRKDGRFSTGVFHLWHPLADPSQLSVNQQLLDSIAHSSRIRALLGLSALRAKAETTRDVARHAEARQTIA